MGVEVTGDFIMLMLVLREMGVLRGVLGGDIWRSEGASLLEQKRGKTFQQKTMLTAQRMRRWRNIRESEKM